MKIVHLTDTYAPLVGGIERQIERLAGLQVAAGHDVTVVSGRHAPLPAHHREAGVLVRRPARPSHRLHALPLHVDDMDADVFHAHLSVLSPATVRACAMLRAVGLPLAVTVHSMWPTVSAFPRAVVRFAALDDPRVAWSAVSRVAAARVRQSLSPGLQVDVVPNAVDLSWWRNRSPAVPRDRVLAVVVARLARRKRVLPVLRSLARDWPAALDVAVIGEGPQARAVADLVERTGVGDRVQLLGSRSPRGVRRILHTADLFVASSALESFGIAALEARAAGLPVLARRGTGVSDFIRDGVDGGFAGSDASLADGLRQLVAEPAQLAALRANAAQRLPAIDQTVALGAVDRLYDRALELRRGRGFPRPAREAQTPPAVTIASVTKPASSPISRP